MCICILRWWERMASKLSFLMMKTNELTSTSTILKPSTNSGMSSILQGKVLPSTLRLCSIRPTRPRYITSFWRYKPSIGRLNIFLPNMMATQAIGCATSTCRMMRCATWMWTTWKTRSYWLMQTCSISTRICWTTLKKVLMNIGKNWIVS